MAANKQTQTPQTDAVTSDTPELNNPDFQFVLRRFWQRMNLSSNNRSSWQIIPPRWRRKRKAGLRVSTMRRARATRWILLSHGDGCHSLWLRRRMPEQYWDVLGRRRGPRLFRSSSPTGLSTSGCGRSHRQCQRSKRSCRHSVGCEKPWLHPYRPLPANADCG